MNITINSVTQRLRIYAFAVRGWSKKELAEKADVAEICLRHIHDDNWNPTLETLRKLEKVIPDDWGFEQTPILFTSPTITKGKSNDRRSKKRT